MPEQNKPDVTNIAIQQLNMVYNPDQDRLLFRIGLQDNIELQVWLTYRISRQLWQLLSGKAHFPAAKANQSELPPQQALEQFKQEAQAVETLQKMDFATAYQPREKVQNDGAMLAVKLRYVDENAVIPVLHIVCLEGLTASINLNQEMTLAICNMLQLAAKEAGWDIGAPALLLTPEAPATQKVLH